MKLYSIILSFALIGCGGWEKGSGHYKVFIDPLFEPKHVDAINYALNEWGSNSHNKFDFTPTDNWRLKEDLITFEPTTIQGLTVREQNDYDFDLAGLTTYFGTTNLIQLALDQNDSDFFHCTLHETGHALGLLHSAQGSVMGMGLHHTPDHLTCQDKYKLCEAWDCTDLEDCYQE